MPVVSYNTISDLNPRQAIWTLCDCDGGRRVDLDLLKRAYGDVPMNDLKRLRCDHCKARTGKYQIVWTY